MPLSSEQVYNDLNGSDCKEILLTRFADLLNSVQELSHNITLPRVRMSLSINLEVFGRTPSEFTITDSLTIRAQNVQYTPELQITKELEAVINSDVRNGGQAPDQIREEHGVPIMVPTKGSFGVEDVPTVREDRIKYASFVTQDYGPMRGRTGQEAPLFGEVISQKNTGGGRPDVSPDMSRLSGGYTEKYDGLDTNGQGGK